MRLLMAISIAVLPLAVSAQRVPLCHTTQECQDQVRQSSTILDSPAFWADHPASASGLARTCAEKKPGWEAYARACVAINRKR